VVREFAVACEVGRLLFLTMGWVTSGASLEVWTVICFQTLFCRLCMEAPVSLLRIVATSLHVGQSQNVSRFAADQGARSSAERCLEVYDASKSAQIRGASTIKIAMLS
jgi:hypothetical protein